MRIPYFIRIYSACLLFFLLTGTNTSFAEEIVKALPNGILARANYMPGDTRQPAILIIHGFLTTHNFNTIYRMTNELASNDFTVLSPTLSLGIDKRESSMACEAIHTHSLQDDLKEIEWWIQWLKKKGHQQLILVGHSTGSIELVVYGSRNPDPAVKGIIATALLSLSQRDPSSVKIINRHIRTARDMIKNNNKNLGKFKISFCDNNYTAPAKQYLSYITWTGDKLLLAAKQAKIPLYSIIAGEDLIFRKNWSKELSMAGVNVKTISGAGHFFDAQYEFEFYDAILNQINSIISN